MANLGTDPTYDDSQRTPTTPPPSPGGLQYDLLGTDPSGKAVYRGSDGQLYTDSPGGVNGFGHYSGTWPPTTQTPTPPPGSGELPTTQPPPTSPYPSGQPPPTFTPPTYTPPPAFSYADFVAPNPNDLNSDPAYQYTLRTEQDRIQKSAAARGVLNTGGTINDLLGNAADIAGAGYHDLFNRSAQTYGTNRSNALQTYNTNYGTQYTDPYKFDYQGLQDQYNAGQHNFDLGNQYAWYRTLFNEQQANDTFNHKFSIYSTL